MGYIQVDVFDPLNPSGSAIRGPNLQKRIIQIDEKTARNGPFFAENQFLPADEFVGLVVQKCHFDATACAEARWLALWGQPARKAGQKDDKLTKTLVLPGF